MSGSTSYGSTPHTINHQVTSEENIILSIIDNKEPAKVEIPQDDLDSILELINSESEHNNTFNNNGIIVGTTLLTVGVACSLGTIVSSHSLFNKYKNINMVNKVFSIFAIPLTTTGIAMTSFFVLNKNKTHCTY